VIVCIFKQRVTIFYVIVIFLGFIFYPKIGVLKVKSMIIVQKYGGSSVADNDKLYNVAKKIKKTVDEGNKVVVVVSAQGKTTDLLINKAYSIDKDCSKRELDVLISTGEQQSIALLAITLEKLGVPAISFTGEQAGIYTSGEHTNARIDTIRPFRIFNELDKGKVVVVAGFQGVDEDDDINTLGRGGSDTTAIALAYALAAERCDIYSDVDGIYTADPRVVERAIRLDTIDYDTMLELSSLGAKVLNNRSVELAKKYEINLTSGESFSDKEGTKIVKNGLESANVTGFTADKNVAVVTIFNVFDEYDIFSKLADRQIAVDVIGQSIGLKEVSFSIKSDFVDIVRECIVDKYDISICENCGKVSAVGCGLLNKPEMAKKIYEALYENNIPIKLISSSEIKFSVIVDVEFVDIALNAIHNKIVYF